MGRGPIYRAMRSTKLQLLVTLAAALTAAGFFAARGLPPSRDLFNAAYDWDLAEVRRAVDWGYPADPGREYGVTPLHGAVARGFEEPMHSAAKEVVELLVAHGVDINAKEGWWNRTKLHEAAEYGSTEVLELLISCGATVDAKMKDGNTPLHVAVNLGHKEAAEALLIHGADVNAMQDQDPWTPLHIVAYSGRRDLVELLLTYGADVNAKTSLGRTPLQWAALQGHKDVAELLIAKGANINGKDNDGRTALGLATQEGHTELADLLPQHGAKE